MTFCVAIPASQFAGLLAARGVDVAIGPASDPSPDGLVQQPFLNYEVLTVARPKELAPKK